MHAVPSSLPDRPASAWRRLALPYRLAPDTLAETLDGGQAFRWRRAAGEDHWGGQWGECAAELRADAEGNVFWRAPEAIEDRVQRELPKYLGNGYDFAELADRLPWRTDGHLARALADFPGLTLLRQPFGETLLGFLCSATKQIVQIKRMLALLAERLGAPLGQQHALPTWARLAEAYESELRACQLGFRARHVHRTALFLAARPGWLEETEALPYGEARERLLSLPGVGEKIADCVLLFGAGRFEAFPVDVWILKALERRYGLEGWNLTQLAHFGRVHFGPLAGLAQQYLFAWERRHGRAP